MVKHLPAKQETQVQCLGWEDPLEKRTATHSSIPAWRIPWTEEPDCLQSMGSQRVRYDWVVNIFTFHFYLQAEILPMCWVKCAENLKDAVTSFTLIGKLYMDLENLGHSRRRELVVWSKTQNEMFETKGTKVVLIKTTVRTDLLLARALLYLKAIFVWASVLKADATTTLKEVQSQALAGCSPLCQVPWPTGSRNSGLSKDKIGKEGGCLHWVSSKSSCLALQVHHQA